MRKLISDYPLILLGLLATIFLSVAVISLVLVTSGIEPSREQLLLASVIGSLLPTVTAIMALYRVQANSENLDVKIDKVHENTQQVKLLASDVKENLEDVAEKAKTLTTIEDIGPYLHQNFYDFRDYFQMLNNNVLLILKEMQKRGL